MPDQPYTDEDLRAEAARQHANLTQDPDFMGIGERMDDELWQSLTQDAFDVAQSSICDLITSAANLSEWAVNLGADGLEPDGHTIQLGVDPDNGDKPQIRMHFAFAPDMEQADRDQFVLELSKVVLKNL